MASIWVAGDPVKDPSKNHNQRDITTQIVISIALGIFAFLAFCFLRPRWTGLYAARKRQKHAASSLPELPDTFFGWIPALYQITEEQVLASAGLDAYVFLSFFRMATKYIAITFFFSLIVMLPIHHHEKDDFGLPPTRNSTSQDKSSTKRYSDIPPLYGIYKDQADMDTKAKPTEMMLWMYLLFTYFFSGLLLYSIIRETKKIIRIRQEYLGSQSTITDRTIRLSGIPEELRSEEMITEAIENLQIGKVESVLLCKDWKELDDLMVKRMSTLRSLERAWTTHLGHPKEGGNKSRSTPGPNTHDEESSRLLDGDSPEVTATAERPKTRIWYGTLGLQSKQVDAIDYFEERLRKLDEKIKQSRNKVFKPMPIAFVTLDSTAAAQMAVQATMDPEPMTLLAKLAPAPSDVAWQNTYISRSSRMLRAWSITLMIAALTVFWSVLLTPLAGLLEDQNIKAVWPQLLDTLNRHPIGKSLLQQLFPTAIISLLSIAVPYLYYWMSTLQGMISQGEVEMSLISKNFFFTFFNLFVVFTFLGTASGAAGYFNQIGDTIKDTRTIAYALAQSLTNLVLFYINLIILQGIGLFPFRLLEFGSVALYPIYSYMAKTPRDYAELVQPPVFSYGFYLPQSILIFIVCIVYSVLPASWFMLFFGLLYFLIGSFTYKYQLLYAMDHRRHSTGRAWPIICNRIVLGLIVFQLALAGILGLNLAVYRAVLVVPLIAFSIWFIVYYQRTYEPLMKFIAIRSLNHDPPFGAIAQGESRYESETSHGRNVDENEETGLRYINPSMILPLEDLWLAKKGPEGASQIGSEGNVSTEQHCGCATASITASQILLSRGVAGVDDASPPSEPSPPAPLIAILENSSIHILSVGPSAPSEITRQPATNSLASRPYLDTPRDIPTTSSLLSDVDSLPHLPNPSIQNHVKVETFEDRTMSAAVASPDPSPSPPIRSRASPRSSHLPSPRSSFSFGIYSDPTEPDRTSSEEHSPTRGRSLIRTPARDRPWRRFSTHGFQRPRTVEWDTALTQQRLMSRDMTSEPQDIFESLLEPLTPGTERFRSSLSEELYKAATWGMSVDLSRFGDHRDTFAILGLRHLQSRRIGLPDEFFERLLPYIDFETYLAIRLSCRCWSEAITRVCPITMPPVSMLPAEVIEQILTYLDPFDFNSARHTCRAWMIASLEERLLTTILQRGGWRSATKADIQLQEELEGQRTSESINEEWMMSKRLATECSLSPNWKGNGLERESSPSFSHLQKPTGLKMTSTTDLTELSDGPAPPGNGRNGAALHFTVSVCNHFVLVAEGCVIYIYSIRNDESHHHGGYIAPLTTVICPHRVLAASMDTSSNRFAVAALLEGRVGLVCDISESNPEAGKPSTPRPLPTSIRDSRGPTHSPRSSSSDQVSIEATNHRGYSTYHTIGERAVSRGVAEATLPEIHGAQQTDRKWTMDDPESNRSGSPGSFHDYDDPFGHSGGMPIANGPRSIYRNLCSGQDPPRSVAICPQRRCVAFGCAAGIELHWIDALTGQDLNRWFPLTAPSDYLYFLPPRPGVDSAKKLRLISSAANPKEKQGLQARFYPLMGNNESGYHSMTWGQTFNGAELWDSAWRGSGWCDHYRAVPMSDGWNILFTEPEGGILCLGSDAPPGDRPMKLVRRFEFVGPTHTNGTKLMPRVYACGGELRWGVRIVVGFGELLWLFVVPPDIFFAGKFDDKVEVQQPNALHDKPATKIEGVEFGQVPGLVDIAVDASCGDLTIWAFAAGGVAYVWQLAGREREEVQRIVLQDGTISSSLDADGDAYMHGFPDPGYDLDGAAPTLYNRENDRIIDKDPDVIMHDADIPEDEGYSSEFELAGGTFAIHAPPLWGRWSEEDADWVPDYLRDRGSEIDDEGLGVDLLEMSRVDVEVFCG